MPEEKSPERLDEGPSVASPSSRRRRVAAAVSRIQPEHLVNEMVTGVDIVKQQTRLAGGGPLSLSAVRP
jgi:hypothetical protein